jgi:hypothetical protein
MVRQFVKDVRKNNGTVALGTEDPVADESNVESTGVLPGVLEHDLFVPFVVD